MTCAMTARLMQYIVGNSVNGTDIKCSKDSYSMFVWLAIIEALIQTLVTFIFIAERLLLA
jgi:hypothetical protein